MKNKKILAISFVLLLVIGAVFYYKNQPEFISKTKFSKLLDTKEITKAKLGENFLTLFTKQGKFMIAKDLIDLKSLNDSVIIKGSNNTAFAYTIAIIIFMLILYFLTLLRKRPKKSKNISNNPLQKQSLATEFTPVISKINFKDVAGAKHLKEELEELVDFLKHPKKYKDFGVKMPKGVLMIGPPGVGKTMVAKAVAGEAGVPFFYQSGATFVEIYVGMGAKRVRELFTKAKSMAPSIIFIDEIDAVGKERGGLANTERDSTLNQLLTQMDGFEDNSGVMVIAATNKKELLDDALLRAGRFDRRIFISLPDLNDRLEILKIYMADKKSDVSLLPLARRCVGFSAASLKTLVNEAGINALKNQHASIEEKDFEDVISKVINGKKPFFSLDEKEKQIQAIYQAAKGLCAYYFDIDYDRFTLVEDILSEAENTIKSRSQLLAKLKFYYCGKEACKEYFKESFTNANEDLQKAKDLISYMQGLNMIEEADLAILKAELQSFIHAHINTIKRLGDVLLREEMLKKSKVIDILKEN